ncbi:MAG TPA: hypothetical protein PKZ40_05835 [Anaerolineaceae bacterium]|nr:hypothetical protein [Anaerolineaceae bacterium]
MTTIDYRLLKGEDLFTYFTQDHPDKELSSLVEMLPLALGDWSEAVRILEELVRDKRELIAVYPEFDNIDTSKMELLGSIPDGLLYLK